MAPTCHIPSVLKNFVPWMDMTDQRERRQQTLEYRGLQRALFRNNEDANENITKAVSVSTNEVSVTPYDSWK